MLVLPFFYELVQLINQNLMRSKLVYLISGVGLGALGHYAYRQYNPERRVNLSTQQVISSYLQSHKLQQGYLITVLKSLGFMLKGFYHYGMDTQIKGFNFNSTYLKSDELRDQTKQINNISCIFSPTEYLCGHPQIQHGGATATIIDQNFGYLAIFNTKSSVATVDLHIKYKRPVKKDQFYVFEGKVVKKEGRKIWVKGAIKELETGQVKVESEGLFYTVHWDNQMTRVLEKFFQTIHFKDYESIQNESRTHQDYVREQNGSGQKEEKEVQKTIKKKIEEQKLVKIKEVGAQSGQK